MNKITSALAAGFMIGLAIESHPTITESIFCLVLAAGLLAISIKCKD